MDWDMKMEWEMSELDPNAEPNISLVRPGSSDCSVDLKLGGLGDFGLNRNWKDHQQKMSTMTDIPSSSSKRARIPNSSNQNVSCSVDGCKADLSNCREYHKRHKVCEVHSKTPTVSVNGQDQRFCQQCSRFHLLVEFDEVKRSCRKRLDGHNRRRRKPQPDSYNSGNRFSLYGQSFPNAPANSSWPMLVKSEDTIYSQHPHQFSSSLPQSFKEIRNFPYLQDCHQPESSRKMYPNEPVQAIDSDCALSLLSTQPLDQIMPERIPMAQPLFSYNEASSSTMHVPSTGFSCTGLDGENGGVEMNCNGLFDSVVENCSDSGSQAVPFSWQ